MLQRSYVNENDLNTDCSNLTNLTNFTERTENANANDLNLEKQNNLTNIEKNNFYYTVVSPPVTFTSTSSDVSTGFPISLLHS